MKTSVGKQVLIIQPLPVMLTGLHFIIAVHSEMKVCAEATTLARARQVLSRQKPDLVIVDSGMEHGEGFTFLRELGRSHAGTWPVVFGSHQNAPAVERAFKCGARAVISHRDTQESILAALIAVTAGRQHIAPCVTVSMARQLMQPATHGVRSVTALLSDRELQIYRLLGQGLSLKEVAGQTGISIKTIESNEARMKDKLGLKNNASLRHQATLFVGATGGQDDGEIGQGAA